MAAPSCVSVQYLYCPSTWPILFVPHTSQFDPAANRLDLKKYFLQCACTAESYVDYVTEYPTHVNLEKRA
jgi:hypothetical protein